MARNIGEVVDRMLAVIPQDDVLVDDFKSLMESVRYCPPEQIVMWWGEGGRMLHDRFGDEMPTEGWQKQVVDIWVGRA